MQDIKDSLIQTSRSYVTPPDAVDLLKQHPPLIICGVTASGKNVIQNYIVAHANYAHIVTHTTRPMRTKEVNGVDHWFVSEREMLRLLEEQAMIETQPIHGGFVYGTSFAAYRKVIEAGKRPLIDLNITGINKLSHAVSSLESIFILPPSFDVWMDRLGGRDFMSDGEKARRLRSARDELEEALTNKNLILLVNHELDETAQLIMQGVTKYAYNQEKNYNLANELIEYLRTY